MRVIVTGGSGLIGRALARSLAASGTKVVVLSRDPNRPLRLPSGVRAEQWDGRTAAGWGSLAEGAQAIVNLAGENLSARPWTQEQKRRILESRLNAGRAVVEAVEAASQRPSVVVQASGVNYYGFQGDEGIAEGHPPADDFLARVCIDWEASTAPVETLGVRRVVLRSALVLSARGGALPRMVMPFRLFVGGPLGNGRQWYSWIHIADEVAAIRFLIGNEAARGPFNLASPHPVTNSQFARVLGRVLGRPALIPTPALALKLVFGEMASVLLQGQRALPRRLLEMGFTFRFPELEPALRELLTP